MRRSDEFTVGSAVDDLKDAMSAGPSPLFLVFGGLSFISALYVVGVLIFG